MEIKIIVMLSHMIMLSIKFISCVKHYCFPLLSGSEMLYWDFPLPRIDLLAWDFGNLLKRCEMHHHHKAKLLP